MPSVDEPLKTAAHIKIIYISARNTTVALILVLVPQGDVFPWGPGVLCSLAALVAAGLVFLLPETTNRKITQQDDSRHDVLEGTSQRFIDA